MARRGFGSTALRAALGAVTGVAEGLQQRDVVAAEKKRMADAADRQAMLDSITLINSGYLPEGVSMDAPGAAPRPAFDTQTVGGRKFTRTMSPSQQQHMDAVERERAENRSKRLDASLKPVATPPLRYTEGESGINVFNPKDGTSTFQPYAKGYTPKSTAGSGKAEPSDATKRQLGNQYMASQARNPALMAALQNTFSNDPEAATDPGLAAYDLMKSKMIPKLGAGKGYEPPKPPKDASGLDKLDQEIRDAVAARKASIGATSPAAAPAAAKSTGQSDAIIDQDRYAKDADYRAWVDSQNK